MKSLKHLSFGLCTFLSVQDLVAASSQNLNYTVRLGDTLGSVLGGLGLCPLWGPSRFIEQTIKINSSTFRKNGNYLVPKTKIKLPVTTLIGNPDYKISDSNEVSFTSLSPRNKCAQIQTQNSQKVKSEVVEYYPTPSKHLDEDSGYGILNAETDIFYSTLNVIDKSTQDTATLLSRSNKAYQFSWEQQWDSSNKTYLQYRSEKHNYEGIENKISTQSINLVGIGIGYERKMRENLKIKFKLQGKEEIFLLAKTITNLELQRAIIPQLSVAPSYRLFSKGPFDLFGDLELKYLMPGKTNDYNIQAGQGYTLGLSLTQKIKDFNLYGRSFYGSTNQDTSIMKKTTKVLGIGLGVSWGFGK